MSRCSLILLALFAIVFTVAESFSPAPLPPPTPPPLVGSGAFHTVPALGTLTQRHEACAVWVSGKVYLIGGRGIKPVDVYDPSTNQWTSRNTPKQEMNHMQCVAYRNRYIYIASSWFGGFPNEQVHNNTFIYDTWTDSWDTAPGLGNRSRGSAALALYNGKFYLAMGNRGGHGVNATTLGEFDVYDPVTKEWTALPDAPDARDHAGGGIIGDRFCISGGRDGGVENFFESPITRINCYNFISRQWEQRAHMPYGRAGAATGTTCQGLLMIAGGEGKPSGRPGKAFSRVDLYDVVTDSFKAPVFLEQARHGSGLAITDCGCGNIYLPSGSGALGGAPELFSMEVWSPDGLVRNCTSIY